MHKTISVTLQTATLTLAYIQHYTCKYLPGRCLSNTHLRRLTAWLGCPDDSLRTARHQPALAAHLSLLEAANLLQRTSELWYLTPAVYHWLEQPPVCQYEFLMSPIMSGKFTKTLKTLGFADCVPIDMIAYIQQQLERQSRKPQSEPGKAYWHVEQQDTWHLCLPPNLPPKPLFHLLQIGHWLPNHPLTLTPITIAQAAQHGYSLTHISYLLEKTTGKPLLPDQQQQLLDWYRRHETYQLRPVLLLSVKQAEQLSQIMNNGNLRAYIQKQISPRHAITSPDLQPSLQKWAARRGYLLDAPATTTLTNEISPTGYQWLGLLLLSSLGKIIPLPYPPPHTELEALAPHISAEEQSQLSILAEQILSNLQDAINGRDAFFPALQSPTPQLLQKIECAIQKQTVLTIQYCALNATEPKRHTIEPLRLEQRGKLYYLHAYSRRAEANLTFRLDRIRDIRDERGS